MELNNIKDLPAIGDLCTNEVRVGQIWRNYFDKDETYEVLKIYGRNKVKAIHRFKSYDAVRIYGEETHDDYDPWINFHSCVLVKE